MPDGGTPVLSRYSECRPKNLASSSRSSGQRLSYAELSRYEATSGQVERLSSQEIMIRDKLIPHNDANNESSSAVSKSALMQGDESDESQRVL